MNHIRKFQSFRKGKRREEIIKEAVFQVNDIYKVKTTIDIPQSMINAYVKKVKDNTGKNLRQFFGDMDIAEEIVKFVAQSGLDADTLSATALVGGAQGQAQGQGQAQPQAQTQPQSQGQVQVQTQGQGQVQAQPQAQGQAQPQAQPQAQGQGQAQAQPQAQGQAQAQPQGQGEFEEVQGQGQAQKEEEEGEEELPA
jgi:hypothetical protein